MEKKEREKKKMQREKRGGKNRHARANMRKEIGNVK